MVGTVLGGRYELLELIGTGGMAHVYKARCRTLNRFVAIKILKDEYKDDKEFVKKFYVESQSAASLSNVNIVSIYDVGEEAGINYIVMEYVEGVTLKDVIKKNHVLNWKVALNCGLQILNALDCAHKNGIVHRDIKPQNIIATYDGILKVADFGIAKAINGNETKKIDESVIGSVHYISPEQAKGIMIDARSDIYSLGIVMYEMLTGRLPFEGENPVSVALMHLNSEPEFIKDINVSVPLELANIVHKAMRRDIAQRYQSAREMINDLNEFKRKESVEFPNLDTQSSEDTKIIVKESGTEEKPIAPEPIKEYKRYDTINHEKQEKAPLKEVADKGDEEMQKSVKKGKNKKPRTKSEKAAVYSAVGVSGVIILVMLYVFLNMFFPNLKLSGLFKSKEYYLEDYTGQNIDDVKPMLEKEGFKVETEDGFDEKYKNKEIISQRPSGEMNVKVRGTTIYFTVNVTEDDNTDENEDDLIAVPSVVSSEASKAKETLSNLGFKVIEKQEESDSVSENHVIRQSPASGSKLKDGGEVTIYISTGKKQAETVKVPNFIGLTRDAAKSVADTLGLQLSVTESDEGEDKAGKVVSQGTAKDTKVEKGSTIKIVVGRKPETTSKPNQNTQTTTPQTVTKTFTITLPEGVPAEVIIKKDNAEVVRKNYSADETTAKIDVSGSGTHHIVVTVNGQEYMSENVKFN